MKQTHSEHGDKARIPRLVWMLSAMGIGAGAFTLGMEYHALAQIRAQRERAELAHTQAAESVRALRIERETVFRDLEEHFSEYPGASRSPRRAPHSLDHFAAECKHKLAQLENGGAAGIDAAVYMEQAVASLSAIHRKVETYQEERDRIADLLREEWRDVRKDLVETRATAEKLEGRQRLRQEVLLRRYRNATKGELADLAFKYIEELELARNVRTLASELGELALLTERLHGEERIDQLVSLKDNEIRQTLTRLRRTVEKETGAGSAALTSRITSLREAIFGKGAVDDANHQTLVIGQGGLFRARLQTLTLKADGRRLRKAVTALLNDCLEAERGLDSVLSAALDTNATRAESVLRAAWRDTLLAGIVVVGVFLILTRHIARLGRLAEVQLRAKYAELEAAMEQLEAAKQDAESASRAKSEFLANMSHEIRTPMTAILGFADQLLEDGEIEKAPQSRVEAINTIRRNGRSLLVLINDILDLSKIEAGKMTVERRDCHPCQIVAEVVSLMRVRAESKGLPFSIDYIGALPETIQSDTTRLRQILINLVGNAIKFTEVGAVRLVIRLVHEGGRPCLQFDVIDTGLGMTEAQVGGLFQAFTQADTSTTRKFGGTGLGLTICKRFAELLGGDITVVETEMGVGTTFRATMATGPLDGVKMLEDPLSATVVADNADSVAQFSPTELHGCHVLLAEDGLDNQRLISFMLKKAGADVTLKENGKLAFDAALAARDRGNPFDVILMDMQMPVMDGYEASSQLRRKGYTGLIIALTAHAMDGDRQKCLDAGCDDYATKPIDRQKLFEAIRTYLPQGETVASSQEKVPDELVSELADEDMLELVEMFVSELPDRIAAIEGAIAEQDLATLATLAHQLKGSAGGFGFPSITEAAKALESSAKAGAELEMLAKQTCALAELCGRASAVAELHGSEIRHG